MQSYPECLPVDADNCFDLGQVVAFGAQRQQRALRGFQLQEGLFKGALAIGLLQQLLWARASLTT